MFSEQGRTVLLFFNGKIILYGLIPCLFCFLLLPLQHKLETLKTIINHVI